jgi:hypothetical protein
LQGASDSLAESLSITLVAEHAELDPRLVVRIPRPEHDLAARERLQEGHHQAAAGGVEVQDVERADACIANCFDLPTQKAAIDRDPGRRRTALREQLDRQHHDGVVVQVLADARAVGVPLVAEGGASRPDAEHEPTVRRSFAAA